MSDYSDFKKKQKNNRSANNEGKILSAYENFKQKFRENYTYNLDDNAFNDFIADYNSFIETAQKDNSNISYKTAQGFKNQYSGAASTLRTKYTELSNYLNHNKGRMSEQDYNDARSFLEIAKLNIDNVEHGFGKAAETFSQWDTEEDYLRDKKIYETNQMTAAEIEPYLRNSEIEAQRSALVARQQEIKNQIKELGAVGNKGVGAQKKTELNQELSAINMQIKELDEKTSQNAVAYTTADGEKITWQTLYSTKKREEETQKLANDAVTAADFEEQSKYVSTKLENRGSRLTSDYGLGYDDLTYEYINDVDGMRDKIQNAYWNYASDSINGTGSSYENKGLDYMTKDEVKIYNYYYATEGKEKADRYLDLITDSLIGRKSSYDYKNKIKGTFGEYTYWIPAGIDQYSSNVRNLFNTTDDYIPASSTQRVSSMVRENIGEKHGKLGTTLYDLGTTTTNMLPSILASTAANIIVPGSGRFVGAGLMGMSAAGGAYQEMLNLGYDKSQARTYSALVGGSEALLSTLFSGISKLGGKVTNNAISKLISGIDNGLARFAIEYGGKIGSEALEEGLQEVLTPFFENIAIGIDINDWDSINWEEAAYSALLGALSAGIFETVPGAISTVSKNIRAKSLYSGSAQDIVAAGLEMPEGSAAYNLATKYQAKLDSGKQLSGSELNRIVEVTDTAKINRAVQLRLTELGETSNVSAVADVITKQVMGENTTTEQNNTLKNSQYGARVLNELSPENIQSDNYSSEWVKNIGTYGTNASLYNQANGSAVDNGGENGYNNVGNGIVNGVNTDQGNISEEQRERFTSAILRYKSSESYTINAKLRENEVLDEAEQELVDTLDAALQSLPTYEGTVYRNLVFDDSGGVEVYNDFVKQHVVGEPIFYNQFVSCSKTEDGYTVDGEYKVQLIVEGKQARDVDGYGNNMEKEVVFTRDSVFIVTRIDVVGQNATIYLKEDVDDGYNTIEESRTTVRDMQESYIGNGNLQSVSTEDSNRYSRGAFRPQSTTSGGQRNTIRTEGRQGTVLSAESGEQITNRTNVEADQGDGSAFSMDENSDSQSAAKGITEPDISKDTRSYEEQVVENMSGKENTKAKDRREVKRLGKLLGWEVRFDDIYARDKQGNIVYMTDKDGRQILDINGEPIPKRAESKVNKEKKIITFDYSNSKPIKTLLKHELTHFLETNAGVYRDFLNKVIESDAFKNWLQTSKNTDLKTYRDSVIEKYKGTNGFETAESSQISAYYEMVAEFVEENLFGDGTKMVNEIVKQMNTDQRSKFAQFIDKIFEKLKNFFSGKKQQSEIEALEQEWLKAYKAAEQTWQQQKNTTDENSGEQYAINSINELDIDIQKNLNEIINMNSVIELSGQEFSKGEKNLVEQVDDFFSTFGYSVENSFLGDVDITARGAKDSIAHGIGRKKAIAFAAVPEVIKHGKIIDFQKNWKGRGYDTVVLAAPITIGGIPYYEGVIVIRDSNNQRFYVHEVITERRTDMPFKTGADKNVGNSGGKSSPSIHSLLDKVRIVKENKLTSGADNNSSMQNGEKYSLATDNEVLLSMYENGEITREEYLKGFNTKSYGLKEITDLNAEDADTTQPISKSRREADGDSDSKFWESLQKSNWFDDGLKAEFAGDEFIEKYKSISNKETLLTAKKELEEGGAAYVKRWHALDAQHASLIDTAVGFILLDGYRRNGDTVSAVATAEKLREIGTAGGQQIQIFSILGRLSPEAMLQYAQRELDKAFEIMVEKRSKDWIDKNKSKFSLTKEDMEFIERRVLQASILPEGRDKAVCMAEIAARIQDKLPPARSQGFKAWQRISMLLNPKTNVRNILGNATIAPVFIASDFFGTGIDKIISKKTGIRTTGVFGAGGLKENAKAFKKGAWETLDDFKRHINTRNQELNRFDLNTQNMTGKSFNENHSGKLAKQLNDCAKVLNALDRMTSFCLEMGDRPFYEMWFVNSINNQMKLNNVKEPTPEMITIASAEALQRTWQDSNSYVTMVQNIKKGLNGLNVHGYGLGDVFVKFSKTPANLTKAIVDFSPIGLVKGLSVDAVNFKNAVETGRADAITQKKFVDSLSKGIAGTMLYILFAALAANGLITGAGDEDKDANAMEKYILGVPEYSIKLFGKWWSYEWMQPVGGAMAIVADYMQNKEENPDNEWYDNIIEAIRAGGEVLYNQSFMQSLQTLFTADGIIDGVVSGVLDDPSVLIPQFVSQIASATDKYRRVTYSNKNPWETAINKVKVKLPGLRQTLEIDKDILGRDIENSQGNFFDAFLNPANTYIASNNDVTDELYNLYKSTGDNTVIPRKAANSVTVKGKTHYFEIKEKNQYQKVMGETTSEILEDIFKSSEYKTLTDSEKVKLINNVFNYAVATAKAETVIYYDVLSAIYGDALSETKYNSLSEKSKKALAAEYFLSDYYDSKGKSKIKTTEAEYFLEKIIENKKKKSGQYSTNDINKIISNN